MGHYINNTIYRVNLLLHCFCRAINGLAARGHHVRLSVAFVYSVETNKPIINFFRHRVSVVVCCSRVTVDEVFMTRS